MAVSLHTCLAGILIIAASYPVGAARQCFNRCFKSELDKEPIDNAALSAANGDDDASSLLVPCHHGSCFEIRMLLKVWTFELLPSQDARQRTMQRRLFLRTLWKPSATRDGLLAIRNCRDLLSQTYRSCALEVSN